MVTGSKRLPAMLKLDVVIATGSKRLPVMLNPDVVIATGSKRTPVIDNAPVVMLTGVGRMVAVSVVVTGAACSISGGLVSGGRGGPRVRSGIDIGGAPAVLLPNPGNVVPLGGGEVPRGSSLVTSFFAPADAGGAIGAMVAGSGVSVPSCGMDPMPGFGEPKPMVGLGAAATIALHCASSFGSSAYCP